MGYLTTPEKKRMQERILYNLRVAFELSEKDGASHFAEAMDELEFLKDDYSPEVTAVSVLQDLSDLSQGVAITNADTGKPVSLEDFQDLVFQKVEMLSNILGIKLGE